MRTRRAPLRLRLSPSRQAAAIGACLRVSALFAPWAAGLAPEYGALAALWICADSRARPFSLDIEFDDAGGLTLTDGQGRDRTEDWRPVLVTAWLVVLLARRDGVARRIWLWRDACHDPQALRRLRARLAWQ